MEAELERLRAEVARLKAGQQQQQHGVRGKMGELTGDVVDSNPYSRLMALKRMGVVPNYERIRDFGVAVVGMGGVGSVTAEMLCRCGVGRLLLFDYDTVQLANMNRLFYRPQHVGMSKVDAAASMLSEINPDVAIRPFSCNVTTVAGYDTMLRALSGDSEGGARADLVLCCVDNFEARIVVNGACNELGMTWLESGVSENAVSGHIQLMVPGRTACFQCAPPLIVASGISEKTIKRDGVCAASLPTTMGLVAALLAQATLKHLLEFGDVSCFVGYNAMRDFFPRDTLRPNPECASEWCRKRQQLAKEAGLGFPPRLRSEEEAEKLARGETKKADVQHEENNWGIELVSGDQQEAGVTSTAGSGKKLAEGIEYEYELPSSSGHAAAPTVPQTGEQDGGESLEGLAAQLKALQTK